MIRFLLALALSITTAASVHAQDAKWPDHPIRFIVPLAGRRRRRRGGAPDRPEAQRKARPAGDRREPRRRQRHHRHRRRRQGAAGRLHARHGDLDHPCHRPDSQSQASLRPGQGFLAGGAGRDIALCPHRASERAGQDRRRTDRARQAEARQPELLLGREASLAHLAGRAVLHHGRVSSSTTSPTRARPRR